MKKIILIPFVIIAANAAEVIKWRGETLRLNLSLRNPTHIVFDEEIQSDIYPKEENINIIRNGKDIFFRYNPYRKTKIVKKGDDIQKVDEGIDYRGNIVKVWFVGKETGTNYALEIWPVETYKDTFYIRNEAADVASKLRKDLDEPRIQKITNLAQKAARDEPVEGYAIIDYKQLIRSTIEYDVTIKKTYKGLIYDVDIYEVEMKKPGILDEFKFTDLPKERKVFIGLVSGWEKSLYQGEKTNLIIVSEK